MVKSNKEEDIPIVIAPATVVSPDSPTEDKYKEASEIRQDAKEHAAGKREDTQTTEAGQRRVNLIWEHVQAFIAVYVMFVAVLTSAYVIVAGLDRADAAFLFITNMASLIVGFYFSRTNHSAIGGIGKKDDQQEYKGR